MISRTPCMHVWLFRSNLMNWSHTLYAGVAVILWVDADSPAGGSGGGAVPHHHWHPHRPGHDRVHEVHPVVRIFDVSPRSATLLRFRKAPPTLCMPKFLCAAVFVGAVVEWRHAYRVPRHSKHAGSI